MSLILTDRERLKGEVAWFWDPIKEKSFAVGFLETLSDVQDYMISWKQTTNYVHAQADLTFIGWAKDERNLDSPEGNSGDT